MDHALASTEINRSGATRRHGPRSRPDFTMEFMGGTWCQQEQVEPAVAMRGLDYSYDEAGRPNQVLFGLNLEIQRGEVVLLTGPSGCGKTTLLTLIGGLRSVECGELYGPRPRAPRLLSPMSLCRFVDRSVSSSRCITCSTS